jgi:dienelactone hydrolase
MKRITFILLSLFLITISFSEKNNDLTNDILIRESHFFSNFLYGAENNPRRPMYAKENLLIKTPTVNISEFTDQVFENYWGYNAENAPLNGIVWFPRGQGPFPVVICVHGNASPYADSEKGYQYLGELFASKGMIFVSVDNTFLNGATNGENDARAYILLKTIEQIISWNKGTVLENKIDTENIALIGHSRGGEAVVNAAIFNRLKSYPDNANFEFDFDYNIKAIVSIAPVEGQYRPAERKVTANYLNHLVIQGAQDGDVFMNQGIRYFNRANPEKDNVISNVWVEGANHAQFNSVWTQKQDPFPSLRKDLLTPEKQQEIAKVLIYSFIDMSFGNREYREFYKNLNKNDYGYDLLSVVKSGKETIIDDFENKIDPTITKLAGWNNSSEGLEKWTEKEVLLFQTPLQSQENYAFFGEWEENAEYTVSTKTNHIEANSIAFDILVYKLETEELDLTVEITGIDGKTKEYNINKEYDLSKNPKVSFFLSKNKSRNLFKSIYIDFEKTESIKQIKFKFQTENSSVYLDNIRYLKGEF